MSKNKSLFFKKKTCVRPTILSWIIVLLILAVITRLSLVGIYYFLTVNEPVKSKTMVIEGWVPAYAIKDALAYYYENDFERIIVTGLPIVDFEFISPFKSTAEATILALKHYGYYDTVYTATVPTTILINRTYNTAVATKMIFDNHPEWSKSFDIYSMGVHSRRTRFMFDKAFPDDFNIGIIANRDRTFDPNHWWKSSKGFRNISNEFIATMYVMLFFHPDIEDYKKSLLVGKYVDSIYYERQDKHIEFSDSLTTPFNKQELAEFHGFNYFSPEINYKINAHFTIDTSHSVFGMKTNTARTPNYRIYGYLDFFVNDTACKLTAYQNIDYKDDKEYGGILFVPFQDKTNNDQTYSGGRYLDIDIPVNENAILDFNKAYNPYCAYSHRWSCPLVPFENFLNVHILAGEKKYKK